MTLNPKRRDITAFFTPLGLLRYTTLPIGATNSVAQFVRIINLILEDINLAISMPFLDDVGVKGLYTDYNGEEGLWTNSITNLFSLKERSQVATGSRITGASHKASPKCYSHCTCSCQD